MSCSSVRVARTKPGKEGHIASKGISRSHRPEGFRPVHIDSDSDLLRSEQRKDEVRLSECRARRRAVILGSRPRGVTTYSFIMDTGCGYDLISQSRVKRLALICEPVNNAVSFYIL